MDIREILQEAFKKGASDLHLTEGLPPTLRINGDLIPASSDSLTREDTKDLIYSILNDDQKIKFEKDLELDFSLFIPSVSRFRVNVHMQKGSIEAAFRVVSLEIKNLKELGLPPIVTELCRKPNGMVLVTGPTGMGKTTTLSAMVDLINSERKCLIVTIEDPIEYLHSHKKSIVKQREVGSDTKSFSTALRHVLRQDPDVILVGELRDLETISTAITAAETGHLVLTTLHTPDAPQTIDRLIDVFPSHQQQQIKIQLSSCLQGIISQQLLPRTENDGRVLATEVMIATPAVRNLIREHKTQQFLTVIQTGTQFGMKSMDQSLKELYQEGLITYETALSKARNTDDLKQL